MLDDRCSWLWRNTTPWLPPDRRGPGPRAPPSESDAAAAADTTTSTPADLTTRTCYESRHPSCTDTLRCPTNDTISPHLHHLATAGRPVILHTHDHARRQVALPPSGRRSPRPALR